MHLFGLLGRIFLLVSWLRGELNFFGGLFLLIVLHHFDVKIRVKFVAVIFFGYWRQIRIFESQFLVFVDLHIVLGPEILVLIIQSLSLVIILNIIVSLIQSLL